MASNTVIYCGGKRSIYHWLWSDIILPVFLGESTIGNFDLIVDRLFHSLRDVIPLSLWSNEFWFHWISRSWLNRKWSQAKIVSSLGFVNCRQVLYIVVWFVLWITIHRFWNPDTGGGSLILGLDVAITLTYVYFGWSLLLSLLRRQKVCQSKRLLMLLN